MRFLTSFDDIIDLALVEVNDYRLTKLYKNQSQDDFNTYVDGFLISAIPLFTKCKQSLNYDLQGRAFISDLSSLEETILAKLWVLQWYRKDNQTYALYRQHLQNSGSFKNHSESQNLKENSTYADKLMEDIDRLMVAYQLEDISDYLS